ncbi:MAG TPA: hypoxanthine phosphoribosyltransferase [Thermoclostridium caenicola]|uniref:Hypoxanthine phosphoribosyltransferase n=2 Tax=Thermoclostridium caenicola TaxID=659425 RepID=A0A1M6HD41_9FIRM|nr:hypoxanthine phosphoribosyltransferase [Thermoclostridium caenicola]SHJ20039.1 hypoxanthine phosphoribosyltransferase [Thermoclostridium caenicola]HOK42223.1 hypoxanthine phosphoribosyltransferase [Thermoclostridium caenicola]
MSKLKVLITREELAAKVKELGQRISKDYEGKELLLVGVLKGGFMFLADLVREITIDVNIDFISCSSYGNSTVSSGIVRILKDIDYDITGKHVLLVEDLIDTGLTLTYLKDLFMAKHCASVKICTILDKPSRRKVDLQVDYQGIIIPDKFVVGYGLDYAEKYRNLPEVYVVEEI